MRRRYTDKEEKSTMSVKQPKRLPEEENMTTMNKNRK
jgi:hypothetical protein